MRVRNKVINIEAEDYYKWLRAKMEVWGEDMMQWPMNVRNHHARFNVTMPKVEPQQLPLPYGNTGVTEGGNSK